MNPEHRPKGQHEKVSGRACAEQGLHILAKPIGPLCNLNCEYCFYLEKKVLFGADEHYRMSDEILSTFITQYIATQPTPAVEFVWQEGEPTLLGLEFFKKVVALQQPFAGTKTITNSVQTNGTLLDAQREIHNRYRRHRTSCQPGHGCFGRTVGYLAQEEIKPCR